MLNKMLNNAEPVLKFKRGEVDDLSGLYGDMYKFAYYSTNDNTVYLCINGFDFPETVRKFEKMEICGAQGYIIKMHDLDRDYDIVFVEKIIKGRKFVALVRMRNHTYFNSRFIFVFDMAEFLAKVNSLVVKDNNRTIDELYFPALKDSSMLPTVENLTNNIPLSPLLKTTIKKIEDSYEQPNSKPNNNPAPPTDTYNQSYGDFKYKIIDDSDDNGSATSDYEPDIKPVAIKPASRKLYSVKSKKNACESDINTADILTVANMRSDDEQSNSSININSIEASPIQHMSPNASNMSFQSFAGSLALKGGSFNSNDSGTLVQSKKSNRKTRISSDLLSTQHSQLNTSSSASRFKPPNLFKD